MALAMFHKLQLDAFLFSFSSKYFYYPWDFLWTMDYLVVLFRDFSSYVSTTDLILLWSENTFRMILILLYLLRFVFMAQKYSLLV